MSWKRLWFAALVLLLLVGLVRTTLFTVDATERAVVTRFGRPLPELLEPGLHVKRPWPIDRVMRIDARLLVFDNEPAEMLTQDKKNVLVDSFICWRVADPFRFLQTVATREQAEARLLDVSSSRLGAAVGQETMEDFLDPAGGEVRLRAVSEAVTAELDALARESFGIEIVDVQINGFNLPQQNRASVIARMRAERASIATQYRSEGEERALEIEAAAAAEREAILAQARSEAEALRGEAERDALALLGEAYARDPKFYRFLRTLESYETIIDDQTTIFLDSDSELMRVLSGN